MAKSRRNLRERRRLVSCKIVTGHNISQTEVSQSKIAVNLADNTEKVQTFATSFLANATVQHAASVLDRLSGKVQNMDPWSMDPPPWTGSIKIWTWSMDPFHGLGPWIPYHGPGPWTPYFYYP